MTYKICRARLALRTSMYQEYLFLDQKFKVNKLSVLDISWKLSCNYYYNSLIICLYIVLIYNDRPMIYFIYSYCHIIYGIYISCTDNSIINIEY